MRILCVVVAMVPALATINVPAQAIVAHRGASHDAPENTIAAFCLAWEKQADAIEGDFYLTCDSQIVCIHDKTTKRVAPDQCERTVAESTLDGLRTLDVGSWKDPQYAGERIPTLCEVLGTVPEGKRIFVEIKCGPEILPVLKSQLAVSALQPEQIVIIAFNKEVATQARQLMPQYKVNWLTAYDKESDQSDWSPSRRDVVEALRGTGATGLGTQGNLDVLDVSFVDAIREVKKEIHVWTINEAAQAQTLKSLGVDSITTDRPGFIRMALESPTE